MKTIKNIAQIISTACFLFLTGCSSPEPKLDTAAAKAATPPATFRLEKGRLTTDLQIPGELVAYREVDLYAKVNGFIKSLGADVGTSVKTGQLLATLEAPELSSQVSESESKLRSLEAIYTQSNATYQRILETSKTPGTISKNDVDIALARKSSDWAQYQAAKAAYSGSNVQVGYLRIHAPFAGMISARNVNVGAYVGPSGKGSEQPIFTLQELDHLRLVISVPESYKSLISLNDTVKFTVRAYPDEYFTARISRRSGVMDKALRSERIELDVYNNTFRLSPGMVAEADLQLKGNGQAFLTPKSSVVNSAEGAFMIESINGKAVRQRVTKGRETDSLTEVFSSKLKAGALYLKHAGEEIRDGSKI